MDILSKQEFLRQKEKWYAAIKKGAVFVYPTDTIYGIGCDATDTHAVQKIRDAKERATNPFSVIVPGKGWILEHCELGKEAEQWLAKLPGPYTLVLKLKKKKSVAENVGMGADTIGVRIPDHWISMAVAEIRIPIVTTSVNKAGKGFVTRLEDIGQDIRQYIDFAIDEGPLSSKPSTLIHAYGGKIQILERQ